MHVKDEPLTVHVPEFWQGLGLHGSAEEKTKNTIILLIHEKRLTCWFSIHNPLPHVMHLDHPSMCSGVIFKRMCQ